MRPACPLCPRGRGGSPRPRRGSTRAACPARAPPPSPSSGLLELRALHHDRVHALVVPEEGPDVLRIDAELLQVPLADLRLPREPSGREEERLELLPRDRDVLRGLLAELLMDDTE